MYSIKIKPDSIKILEQNQEKKTISENKNQIQFEDNVLNEEKPESAQRFPEKEFPTIDEKH